MIVFRPLRTLVDFAAGTMETSVPAVVSNALSLSSTPSVISSLASNVNVVGAAWVLSSAIATTYSTTTFLKYQGKGGMSKTQTATPLASLSRSTLLTLYRFGGSFLLGILAHPNLEIRKRLEETLRIIPAFTLPATFLFVANYANSISLSRIGISLTYTSKCAIPLITVLLTLLLQGSSALPGTLTLLSLIPIALGIAAASWNSPTFELYGFAAAMLSCVAQSALNVSSKLQMTKTTNIAGGAQAQRAMVAVGFVIASIYSIIELLLLQTTPQQQQVLNNAKHKNKSSQPPPPAWLAGMAVTAYHVEYVLSFMFVNMIAPITYGACDAIRRLCIIMSGHFMFGGDPFTPLNVSGISLALLGALAYSITSSSGK
jgi:hypothetical protein